LRTTSRDNARNPLQTHGKQASKNRLRLRISLCGGLTVEADGRSVDEQRFQGQQARLAFAYLVAAHGRPVPREELADAVWGETAPPTWEKGLTVIVSKLRGLLSECGLDGQTLLTSAYGCYRLELPDDRLIDIDAAADSADAAERALAADDLEHARTEAERAVSVARLTFLPGADRPWVDERRRELAEVRWRALICLGETACRFGHADDAARYGEEALVLDPFRESGYRRLMEWHAAAGNRADALRVYERCRRLLAEELGAYPSPETQALHRELLGDPPVESEPTAAPVAIMRPRRAARATIAVAALLVSAFATFAALRGGSGEVAVEPDSAALIDADTAKVIADVPVGSGPIAVAVSERGVWVANADDGTVTHIDPKTRQVVKTIGVGSDISDIATGYGAVWVADGNDGTLTRIDPELDAVEATLDLGRHSPLSPAPVFSVAAGGGSIWATSGSQVVRIDPATNEVTRRIALGPLLSLTAGEGEVWITTIDERIYRIDERADVVTARLSVPGRAYEPVADDESLWTVVGIGRGELWRFDASTGSPIGTVRAGDSPESLALATKALWVANGDGSVARVDPATGRITATMSIGQHPTAVAAGAGGVWVLVRRPTAT
jgi:YVTN family beta-propeller protein